MNSLRKKITIGYYAIGALIVGLARFAFVELHLIEAKVLAGEPISELLDVTLEIRRFEKNYFLYHQTADAAENETYVTSARRLLTNNFGNFATLTTTPRITALQVALTDYKNLMAEYVTTPASDPKPNALESRIRMVGKSIVTLAEEMAGLERKRLQSSLERHRYSLLLSIVALILLVIAIGKMLSRMVAQPRNAHTGGTPGSK